MRPLRQHSCALGVDYEKQLILCGPEADRTDVVLTTPVLYAWHAHNLTTEEGIRHWVLLEQVGWVKDAPVIRLKKGWKICFVGCSEIYFYGILLSEDKGEGLFAFRNSTRTILGSPFVDRKTVFVSYSSSDKQTVRLLVANLERHFNLFFDEKSIVAGDSITEKINDGLAGADALLLCVSATSGGSSWVTREYSYALHSSIRVVPVILDESTPPPVLRDTKYVRLGDNAGAALSKIVEGIEHAA